MWQCIGFFIACSSIVFSFPFQYIWYIDRLTNFPAHIFSLRIWRFELLIFVSTATDGLGIPQRFFFITTQECQGFVQKNLDALMSTIQFLIPLTVAGVNDMFTSVKQIPDSMPCSQQDMPRNNERQEKDALHVASHVTMESAWTRILPSSQSAHSTSEKQL